MKTKKKINKILKSDSFFLLATSLNDEMNIKITHAAKIKGNEDKM